MWHKGISGRGATEIESCLNKHLLRYVSPQVQEITFYSDSCGGQNKNSSVAAMFLKYMSNGSVKAINQKFLVSGHTRMECDSDHSMIEKEKRKARLKINIPHDWYLNRGGATLTLRVTLTVFGATLT